MTAIEQAIRDARKQGWRQSLPKYILNTTTISNPDLLDPSFWQALGKARGLADGYIDPHASPMMEEWKQWWHRFIDHLIEGSDTKSFFAALTTNNDTV